MSHAALPNIKILQKIPRSKGCGWWMLFWVFSHFCCSSALLFLLLGTAKEVWKQIKNQSYTGGEQSQTAANRKHNICLLSSSSLHLKSHLTSKGEKNSFAESLGSEESTSSAGCWLSSQHWLIFLLCHPPSALVEPVVNSALYSGLMLLHSHFVEVFSLPWQKASHFHARLWVVVSDWWLVVLAVSEASLNREGCTMHTLPRAGHGLAPAVQESHQRAGADPGWCRDMGQHSTLNPHPTNQSTACKNTNPPAHHCLGRESEEKEEWRAEVAIFTSDTLI